jgi:hypothetical protein
VNCGPGHIQWNDNTAYSVFSIQLNVSARLLEISRQFNERYTAILVLNTAHVPRFTLCQLWSRTDTKYLQLLIVRPQYSTERICAAIGNIPTLRCALYCKFGVKCSEYTPVYAVWNCGLGHIQCSYSSAYSGFIIQLNVSALLLELSRQYNERYTAIVVPNTAHVYRFSLCQLLSRTYTM